MTNYWLIVERYENWVVDREENFQRFGLNERKRSAASRLKEGDLLIVYVSGRSQFSDVRKVRAPALVNLRHGGSYDTAFPFAISTQPHITVAEERWVPVLSVAKDLSFLSKSDWRQSFRNSLRPIPERDGLLIQSRLLEQAEK